MTTGDGTNKVVVIGDIGGQIIVFEKVLRALGIDPDDPVMPDGLTIVQVGDIVRQIPALANDECVALADALLRVNPGRWIQLIGNHEATAVGLRTAPEWIKADEPLIEDWCRNGLAHAAALIRAGGRDIVVTHAGVTSGQWRRFGRPDADRLVTALNATIGTSFNDVVTPGRIMNRQIPSMAADWYHAIAADELVGYWIAAGSPGFDQIHGHSSVWNWDMNDWDTRAPMEARQQTVVDHENRRTCTLIDSHDENAPCTITGIDWVLGNTVKTDAWPLLTFENAIVIT